MKVRSPMSLVLIKNLLSLPGAKGKHAKTQESTIQEKVQNLPLFLRFQRGKNWAHQPIIRALGSPVLQL